MALRKPADSKPLISQVTPPAAIAGGELQIRGKGFAQEDRPKVTIGEVGAPVIIGSDSFVIARVPEGASAGELVVESGAHASASWACDIGMMVADSLHPVSNPAVDSFGNIFTTFSGSRGQKVPVAVYKIDLNFAIKPFINELMNATAPHLRRAGHALHLQPLRWLRLPGHAQRQYERVRGRHGRRHRHRLRCGTQSLRGRPQRHHLQDQPHAARSSSSPRSNLRSPPTT